MNPSITPGEILLEDYLEPMGISQNAMARAIGVPPRAINEIVHGKLWKSLMRAHLGDDEAAEAKLRRVAAKE